MQHDGLNLQQLASYANSIRRSIIQMIGTAGSGHPGGSLSAADILTVLYFAIMRVDPLNPDDVDRDRFVLAKGHAAPALYAVVAEKGFFPKEELLTLRRLHSRLQGHPDMRKTPGVEASTGSLGQGLSIANGMALAARLDRRPTRVYVLIGDGECEEGQVWEAVMTAAHYGLDNLTAIVDHNGLQIDGRVLQVKSVKNLKERFAAFGWEAVEVDGHDIPALIRAFQEVQVVKGRPSVIIAHTVKGKGVPFMEDQVDWHGTAPNQSQMIEALAALASTEANKR